MSVPAQFAIRPILIGPRSLGISRPAGSAVWRSDSPGFTLIEMLVTIALSLVVLTAVSSLLISGMRDQAAVETRNSQLGQAEIAMQRLVRDLREASSVTVLSSSSISYSEPVATGLLQSVTFACSTVTSTCTDTAAGVQQTAVTHVTNSNVFAGSPSNTSPTYVGITLVLSAPNQGPVTVTDGTGLRNATLGR